VSDAAEHIRAWQQAGLIDEDLAGRLLAHEAPGATSAPPHADRPGVIEALLYLGIVVAGAGLIFFVGRQWDELESWARLLMLALPLGLSLAAGAGMHFSGEPGIRRGGHLAWLLSVVLVGGTLAVAFNEFGGDGAGAGDDRGSLLTTALVTLAAALGLWAVAPSHPQLLGIAGSTVFFAEALGAWPDDYSERIAGMTILFGGLAAVALAELRILRPRVLAQAIAAALTGGGAYHAGFDSAVGWELLSLVAGCLLIAAGVWRASFAYIAGGVATLLVALITFMFEHFEDEIGAPVALMLSGGLIVAAVLVLVQVRGMARARRAHA
jgi:hypothetical protein